MARIEALYVTLELNANNNTERILNTRGSNMWCQIAIGEFLVHMENTWRVTQ